MSGFKKVALSLVMALGLAACGTATPAPTSLPATRPTNTPRPTADAGVLAARVTVVPPALQTYLQRVAASLKNDPPVLLLDGLPDAQNQAQQLAVKDPRFQVNMRAQGTGEPLRNEIFGVYTVLPSDVISATQACKQDVCYRVEMYSFAYNIGSVAIVDTTAAKVLSVRHEVDQQPDVSPELKKIAVQIAVESPEVAAALGGKPRESDAVMAATKTGLAQSRCERSNHLCVPPTFVKNNRALWAIVDLTDAALVGVRWTEVGNVVPPSVSEKRLQDDVVTKQFCQTANAITRNGWQFEYVITSSDGLQITNVKYNDRLVLDSAKVVDWHVSYSAKDKFGYSDAVGCPTFSQAVVVAFNGPRFYDLTENGQVTGFAIEEDFKSAVWPQPCNYFYKNRFEFYTDGRFRPVMINVGHGCGNDGWYRPILRLGLAGNNTLSAWDGAAWKAWTTEQWQAPSAKYSPEDAQFKVTDATNKGYFVQPSHGQFKDGGRGDNPFVYATLRKTGAEGDTDLITIGSCCNDDYRQGPEKFIDSTPEPIANSQVVMWYVPQIKNDDRKGQEYCWADTILKDGIFVPVQYPCWSGPMFVPMK
ncbi:MAG TPA: hypothetical protein PLW39_07760 [Thermoflexales bacterium]|nr:hypothetical protein [Thermoflexales bacterium]HQW35982.1 hypothetical protein [Thermoflexales bacterium]HQZ22147.1 hypothetical protein [Thermoflexales bacterium]